MLYAMCEFANFGSLGIMIAGLSTMCPEKRATMFSLNEIDRLNTLTTACLTAIISVLTAKAPRFLQN